MAELTFQQVFGAGATQTPTTITIQKADLAATGYTPSANNTAESSLLAINLNAATVLTPANRTANIDQNLAIERGYDQTVYRGQDQYAQASFTITAQKAAPAAPLDPDDY